MAIIAIVFLAAAALISVTSLPNIEQYVDLVQAIVTLVVLSVGLYFGITLGRKLAKVIIGIHRKERRRMKIEDQFALARTQNQLSHMGWEEFEHYVGYLFAQKGYKVEVTRARADEGIDAKLRKNGKMYVAQAKFYKSTTVVGRPEVQKFVGAMMGYDGGFFVTTSTFTLEAKEYAKTIPGLVLIDGAALQTF